MLLKLLAVSAILLIHGEYAWIEKPSYKTLFGASCCGYSDCFVISTSEALQVRVGDSILLNEQAVRVNKIYDSEDAQSWACYTGCLFIGLQV